MIRTVAMSVRAFWERRLGIGLRQIPADAELHMADTSHPPDLLREANQYWAGGNELEALDLFSRAILANPQDLASNRRFTLFMLSRLAFAFQSKNDDKSAMRAWEGFLAFEADNAFAQKELGLAHFRQGDAVAAEQLLRPLLVAGSSMQARVIDALVAVFETSKHVPQLQAQRLFQLELLGRASAELLDKFQDSAKLAIQGSSPICIVGMHRSGTSMVSRLLEHLGVHLGPQELLFGPQPDNPEGFFENAPMQQLNQDILSELGGAWDSPPAPDATGKEDAFIHFRNRAFLLAAGIAVGAPAGSPWAWKDPRSSLTLPFWLEALPQLKVVVVVRDPGDVAASLVARGRYNSPEFGLVLWKRYYEQILGAISTQRVHVVEYESFFSDPEGEVQRLSRFAGTAPAAESVVAAMKSIQQALRHNEKRLDWEALPVGQALLPLRTQLRELSKADPMHAAAP